MSQTQDRAESLCDEFSDWVLYDDAKRSVIFNTTEEHLKTLKRELSKLGYREIHQTEIELDGNITYTCVFLHR